MSLTVTIPTLHTERLALRAPRPGDFDAYADVLSTDRARFMAGPFDRHAAWLDWCETVAEWVLHKVGPWTVTARDTDTALGWAGLSRHPLSPEPEMGWLMTQAGEGKGYALEASRAIIAHAFGALRLTSLVSYIRPGNTRAERLAARLGATAEPDTPALPGTIAHRYSKEVRR